MHWLLYISIAILFNSVGKVVHRYILKDEDMVGYAFMWNLVSSLFFIPMLIVEEHNLPSQPSDWFFFLSAAFLWFSANVLGFSALKRVQLTLWGPLSMTKIFFLLIFSTILISERFTIIKVVGTFLIFIGATILTYEKGFFTKLRFEGVRYVLITAFIVSFANILDKVNLSLFPTAFYGFSMYVIPSLVFGIWTGYGRMDGFKRLLRRKLWIVLVAAFLYGGMYYFRLMAYDLTEVSMAFPVSQLSVPLTMLLGYIFLRERRELPQRLFGGAIAFAGALLITTTAA